MGSSSSEELGVTGILKRRAPAWWWLRKNFTLPAVLAIGGILAGAGSWLWAQHTAIRDLRRDLKELVDADRAPELGQLDTRINKLELDNAALAPRLNAFDARMAAQEHEWQVVHDAAQWRPRASQTGRPPNRPGR